MAKRTIPRRPYHLYLAEWIEEKGLTQDQLAERMDCSPGTISKLVTAKMNQTPDWLAAIAYALGPDVKVDDLFRHPGTPIQDDPLRGLNDQDRKRILRAIRALTDPDE